MAWQAHVIPANKYSSMSAQNGPGKISVVIVTYNAAATLQASLDSIYKQAYVPIEIVIIDGKSTDGTVDILTKNTDRIAFWLSEPDKGIYDAMNKALDHITGNWVYFLGADDELTTEFSEMASELTEPGALYYANVLSNGVKKSGFVNEYYQAKAGVFHQAIIYSAGIFKKYRYNTKYSIAADYALNMQCWKDKTIPFIYKGHIIAKYNHTGVSADGADAAFEKDKTALIRQNFSTKIWLRYLFRKFKEKIKG